MDRVATEPRIEEVSVSAYRIATPAPESDGTLEWDATTLVLVQATGGGTTGIGYTYADTATARLIRDLLAGVVTDRTALDVAGAWEAMRAAVRNLGQQGVSAMAISAVDTALWDLKARLLQLPLALLLGRVRPAIPAYGSGGLTSLSMGELTDELAGWADDGLTMVKMKVGRDPDQDLARVEAARAAIGPDVALLVDANGAYGRKQALGFAARFADSGVCWFEEPVPSSDLDGLHLIRDRGPAGMDIAAGEYGYESGYFQRMLAAGAVDVIQADVTRCGGITAFLQVAALASAAGVPLSSHCAPSLHVALGCALAGMQHVEYFVDHVRIEQAYLDGAPRPSGGCLAPDLSAPGMGLGVKHPDLERWRVVV